MNEKRKYPRTTLLMPVHYRIDNQDRQAQAQILDLTPEGMRLWSGWDLAVGLEIDLDITLPIARKSLPLTGDPTAISLGPELPQDACIHGKIMRSEPAHTGGYYLGIAFKDTNLRTDQALIKEFLDEYTRLQDQA